MSTKPRKAIRKTRKAHKILAKTRLKRNLANKAAKKSAKILAAKTHLKLNLANKQ